MSDTSGSQCGDGSSQSGDSGRQGKQPVCHNRKRDCCLHNPCGKPDTRPVYARTMPDGRRYGVVISNKSGSVQAKVVMRHLFGILENCNVPDLNFSQCVPISVFDGNLLIVCEDKATSTWLINAMETITPLHVAVTFINFFGLMKATVVLPYLVPKESTCGIFVFLEVQNPNIKTDKWAVVNRTELDPCDPKHEPIQKVVGNEVLELYIDAESREKIECQCMKMKYIFWTVVFKFDKLKANC